MVKYKKIELYTVYNIFAVLKSYNAGNDLGTEQCPDLINQLLT
jgi:hypothetical protein